MEGKNKLVVVFGALALIACTADDPIDRTEQSDAGVGPYLAPPVVDPLPEATPLSTVAIRGIVDGDRVMIRGATVGSALDTPITGSFCFDVPVSDDPEVASEFELFALGGDGQVSEPSFASVRFDPSAAAPPNATCSGMAGPACEAAEVCTNDSDDDCDGFEPECDADCNGCIDDALEPNDNANDVPILSAGTHFLSLCPCRDDWFAFPATLNQRILATTQFVEADVNVRMYLYKAAPGGAGTESLVQIASTFGSDTETIDYRAESAGMYYLRIFEPASDEAGSYTLTIE